MLCNKCGKELRDGAEFCSNCGAKANSKKEAKKNYIPLLAAIVGIIVVAIVMIVIISKNPSNEVEKNNTQDTGSTANTQLDSESQSKKTEYPPLDAEKYYDSLKQSIILDDLNTCYYRKMQYKDYVKWSYYELEYHTRNGYGYDLNFSFVHESDILFSHKVRMGELDDHCIMFHNYDSLEESSYYLWAGTGPCYGKESYDEALALKLNDKYYGEIPRVEGGECVVYSTDNYVKIYYAVENETHKGYEGVIYDGSKGRTGRILRFVYVRAKEHEWIEGFEEDIKFVVESIKML